MVDFIGEKTYLQSTKNLKYLDGVLHATRVLWEIIGDDYGTGPDGDDYGSGRTIGGEMADADSDISNAMNSCDLAAKWKPQGSRDVYAVALQSLDVGANDEEIGNWLNSVDRWARGEAQSSRFVADCLPVPDVIYKLQDHNQVQQQPAVTKAAVGDVQPASLETYRDYAAAMDAAGKEPPDDFSVPGFINELVSYMLATAPYPNLPLAFCGALALLSLLVGRLVKGTTGLHPNIYLIGLANSASGKNWPRTINTNVLAAANMLHMLGGRFASSEGLEDFMYRTRKALFQIDEFDSLLVAINKPGDPAGAGKSAALCTFYTSSHSDYPLRSKASEETSRSIRNPYLTILGNCPPKNFFDELTVKSCTNGLVGRSLVIEAVMRGRGQKVAVTEIPPIILEQVEFWRDFAPGKGDLVAMNPDPIIIPEDEDAAEILSAAWRAAEDQYSRCEVNQDNAGCSIWGRVIEQAYKLAMLYACSANCHEPRITAAAATWATTFAMRHAGWLWAQVTERTGGDSEIESRIGRLIGRLRARGGKMTYSQCLKASRLDARQFRDLLATMESRDEISIAYDGRSRFICLR